MAADLPLIVAACGLGTAAGLRDRAVVLLGFALLARRSELAALNISDVEHVPGEGLEVTIRSSKTDQSARGAVRRIHYAANKAVCPVRAVLEWQEYLAARGVTGGALFTRIDRWGNVDGKTGGRYRSAAARDARLRPQSIGGIIARACEAAGLDGKDGLADADAGTAAAARPRRYTGHSVRRGGATSMLRAGAQPLNVSRHGRWADGSRAFAGYVEDATGFGDGNPTKGLL
jgi:integrase